MVCRTLGTTRRSPLSTGPLKTGLPPTVQGPSQVVQNTLHPQRIQRRRQRQCLVDFYSGSSNQKRNRKSKQTRQSRVLQPTVLSSKTREQMETRHRSQLPKPIPNSLQVQDGNSRIYPHIAQTRRMGHLNRSVRCISTHPHSPSIKKVPQVSPQGNHIPVHQPSFRTGHGPPSFYLPSEGGKAPGLKTRHPSTPILKRLVNTSHFSARGSGKHNKTSLPGSKPGVHRKPQEIGAHPPAEVRLHRLPFCVGPRPGQTHKRQMEQDPKYIQRNRDEIDSQCTDTYVHHWITCIHGENCETGQDTHETFSMASQDSLESSDALEFSNSLDSQNETTRGMVAKPPKRPSRRIPTPQRSRHFNLYRRIKRRLGRSLKSRLRRRSMVSNRKTPSHKRTGTKGSNPSPTTLLAPMPQETSAGSIRQHNCGSPHKQTGGNPLRRTLCPHVETTHMLQQAPNNTQSTARPRFSQCYCGRPLQEKPNPTHRMVLGSSYLHKDLPTLGTATNRPVCHQPEHQTSNLCVSNPGPTGLGGGHAKHLLEEHDRVRIPSDSIATNSGPDTTVPTMQAHPNSPRLADKTVVLGPGGTVTRHLETTPTNSLSTQTTTEQPIPHSPGIPQPPRMVSRSTALQNQGFTAEVADRIAAPQRLSTRAIYASKWSVFERWCIEQQVDFRSPSIKHICEFMCFLFNEKDRRPSTIEGYRTAIAETLGNVPLDISNNTELARLIASFHRDKPKSSRNLPKWDLSIVLHQLKQPPFEPLQEAPLKYVTWKTVFLLALASGKRHSEIHAWTLDGLLCLGEWDQIQLTPSPSFIAKNQLAKEGNQAVSPVVIPALATPQNDSNEDALLCPVRALSTYLKLTADLRQDKALLFVSYKQGHSKDIQCSTISSWIKNTIKYCYSRVENSDMDLLGVKAHDVRAFAASKAFYGGVSMDQILQACHWKSHNTFTSFYLKDLSGQNQKDLSFHLGSFVAAQQVVTPP